MAGCSDEQRDELEALQSIFPTELTVEQEAPTMKLSICLPIGLENSAPADEDDEEQDDQDFELSLELPRTYPNEPPGIDISCDDSSGVTREDLESVIKKLNEVALENAGMPMVYTLATTAQEEVHHLYDRVQQNRAEIEQKKKFEIDEAERRRLEGTPVTVENFLAWKNKFDDEMARKNKTVVIDPANRRPTGREQFLKDSSLSAFDIRLLEEGGDDLKIDESLFEEENFDEPVGSDLEVSDDDRD